VSLEEVAKLSHENGKERAAALKKSAETRLFIGGEFVDAVEGDMTQPFGGYKQSGNTKDKCFESLLRYTSTKAAWLRLN